ncbi:hypothetical protein Ate01nite_50010 [Actinoplanes teichomyceticus]|nr:hypothetical protein Ate01nite_50010 [Actinoplanes teichomyceticus]
MIETPSAAVRTGLCTDGMAPVAMRFVVMALSFPVDPSHAHRVGPQTGLPMGRSRGPFRCPAPGLNGFPRGTRPA